jgi:hypothetical protein
VSEFRDQLLRMANEAVGPDLPRLRGLLMEAEAIVLRRLMEGRPVSDVGGQTQAGALASARWLKPDEAAAIASVSRAQLYEMARGKAWASRPNRRMLRINEAAFRTWLSNRRAS